MKAYYVKYHFIIFVCAGVTNIEKINSEVLKKIYDLGGVPRGGHRGSHAPLGS